MGSTLRDLQAAYGDDLGKVTADDQGVGWVFVAHDGAWIAFSLGRPADRVTSTSRVEFVELGRGPFLHRFGDSC